jgi:hypothetical protein
MISHAHILQDRFDTLKAATVAGESDGNFVSIAKKRADCVDDTFGGIRCG